MDANDARLCYLQASKVIGPTGQLKAMPVRGRADASLGTVDGVLIDPEQRRVRFFIVQGAGGARMLPLDSTAQVERTASTLRVDCDDLNGCELFDRRAVEDYTEEDAIAPSFRRYIA